jgi:hypothetical protein
MSGITVRAAAMAAGVLRCGGTLMKLSSVETSPSSDRSM